MANDIRETLTDWLRDAYAMESQAVEMLKRQADRIESYPEVLAKVKEHIAVSERQADRLKSALKGMGSDTSSIKTGIGMMMGNAQSLSGVVVGDEIVKAAIFNYAFENFEIANYKALIAAAERAGETQVADVCRTNLAEEIEMSDWLAARLDQLTRTYLDRSAVTSASEAKR